MKKSLKSTTTQNPNLSTGKLPYKLTNDYLFRAVFQSRPKALEGLCRSVLHLSPEDTVSITLQNPIELGKKIENKEFILDLAVLVNNSIFLNLEMQVLKNIYWPERSLSYACRSFDNLLHGDNYDKVLPVIHIGFLDFDLFPQHPEFYATYQLANLKNQQIFSDKLRISVVDLNQIRLATDEDVEYGVDVWARVFKATTWEEVDFLAQNNEYLQEAVSGVRQLTEDEKIRQQCQAREDFYFWEYFKKRQHQKELEALEAVVQEKDAALSEKDAQLAAALARIAELEAENSK